MKLKTSELTGDTLDWAVSKCEGLEVWREPDGMYLCEGGEIGFRYRPSSEWMQGGPIIERERISLEWMAGSGDAGADLWGADMYKAEATGDTALEAAMRCYVASKLGDEVDIPDVLVKE
jgi:hypothetical protein